MRIFQQAVEKTGELLGLAAGISFRSPFIALGIAASLALLAFQSAKDLKIDGNLIALLPADFESVQALDEMKARYGGTGFVSVVIRSPEEDKLLAFAQDAKVKLEALADIDYATFDRPSEFFRKHALYFVETADLEELTQQLEARVEWERRNANPLYMDFEGEAPPPLDLSHLKDKYLRKAGVGQAPQVESPYLLDPAHQTLVLLARPRGISTDLNFTKSVVGQVQETLSALEPSTYHPDLRFDLSGTFTKRVDRQTLVVKDLRLASLVALFLMIGYVSFHFRRVGAVIFIMVPLLTGVLWTFAFAAETFPSLNILTGLLGAILLGLGIDQGIHILTRYEKERGRHTRGDEAVEITYSETGHAAALATLTTTMGFVGPALSNFRAFHEFGVIAGAGMLLVLTAYLLIQPALLGVAEKMGWRPTLKHQTSISPVAESLDGWGRRGAIALFALAVIISPQLFREVFNYDFSALQGGNTILSVKLDDEVNDILGHKQTPMLVMTENQEEAQQVATTLRQKQTELGDATSIDFIVTLTELIPDAQQEKLAIIERLGKTARAMKLSRVPRELRGRVKELREMTQAKPFSFENLPENISRQFTLKNGELDSGFVLVYPAVSLDDGILVRRFANEVRAAIQETSSTKYLAGEALVLADIIDTVFGEAPRIAWLTLIGVFLAMFLLLGNLRETFIAIIPAVMTIVFVLGILPMTNVQVDYLNMVMLPVLFGIAVDGGVHLVTRLRDPEATLSESYTETGRAIIGAILTSGLGFAAMWLTDHPGLHSLSALTLIGLGVNLLACLLGLPAILAALQRKTPREEV